MKRRHVRSLERRARLARKSPRSRNTKLSCTTSGEDMKAWRTNCGLDRETTKASKRGRRPENFLLDGHVLADRSSTRGSWVSQTTKMSGTKKVTFLMIQLDQPFVSRATSATTGSTMNNWCERDEAEEVLQADLEELQHAMGLWS